MIRVSPSQIEKFRTCERQWAFRYIDKLQEPPSKSAQFGTDGHALAEAWLRDGKHPGDSVHGKLIQKALTHLPNPDPRLIIEEDIEMGILNGHALMIFKADCIVPPPISELPMLIDHKFTVDLRWAKTAEELAKDVQRIVYGRYLIERYDAPATLARWIYYSAPRVQGTEERRVGHVRKVEHLLTKEDACGEVWIGIMDDVERMITYKESGKAAKDVPATGAGSACEKFGGCPFKAQCGVTGQDILKARFEKFKVAHPIAHGTTTKEEKHMGLLEDMKAKLATKGADKPTEAPAPTAETVAKVSPGLEAMRRRVGTQVNPPTPESTPKPVEPTPEVLAAPTQEVSESASAEAAATLLATAASDVPSEAPKKRGRKPKAEAPAEATYVAVTDTAPEDTYIKPAYEGQFVLLIDALPVQFEGVHQSLGEYLQPFCDQVCEANKVGHIGLISYQQGYAAMAALVAEDLKTNKQDCVMYASSATPEFKVLENLLLSHANTVIRGTSCR